MKNKLNLSIFICLLSVMLGHELLAQRTISKPKEEPVSADPAFCAQTSFNSFTIVANLSSGAALNPANEFILELSDVDGNFNVPENVQELARVTGPNGPAAQEIRFDNFGIPTNASSNLYKYRIRASLNTEIFPATSDPIPTHYYTNDLNIRVNNANPVIFCNVSSFNKTLQITILDDNDVVVNPDNFGWEWYEIVGASDVLISGETSSSLVVTEVGKYYAKLNFGPCNNVYTKDESNRVTVSIKDVSTVTIVEGPSVSYCPQDAKVLNSSETDFSYTYQWLKDNVAIEGAIGPSLTLPNSNFAGSYTVQINYSDDCLLTTDPVVVTNNGSDITELLPENQIILFGETVPLQITTNAPEGSEVRWYVNTTLQSTTPLSGTTASFNATFVGTYRVEITATDACLSELFSETELYAPVGFEMTIGTADNTSCDQPTFKLELLEMLGLTAGGLKIPLRQAQYSFFNFEWYKNGISTGNTGLSLEADAVDQAAVYALKADQISGGFTDIFSNDLSISIVSSGIVIVSNPNSLPVNGSVQLSVPNNTNYTYQWYRLEDGEEQVIEGETANQITVTEEGSYFVRISSSVCSFDTPVKQLGGKQGLSGFIPNIVTLDQNGINDSWNLPKELTNQQDVEITIYDSRGQVDFKKTNFQNGDWPDESSSSGDDAIYYFIITKNNSVIRKGSVTVMR